MENEVNAAVATHEAEQMAARYAVVAGATREQGGGGGGEGRPAEVSDEDIARMVEVTMLSLCSCTRYGRDVSADIRLVSVSSVLFLSFCFLFFVCVFLFFFNTSLSLLACLARGCLPIFLLTFGWKNNGGSVVGPCMRTRPRLA